MPEIVVHYRDTSESPAQNRSSAQQAANRQEPQYFKNHCPNCRGGVEFAAHGVGHDVTCPHCQRLITLRFPPNHESDPTEQIDGYLRTSSFPKTRAELQFLKIFTLPRELGEVGRFQFSRAALGAPPESIISRFLADRFLQDSSVDVARLLELKSKNELKSLAKVRGISQSGTKEDLAKKLFKADPGGTGDLFRGKTYLTCTLKGQLVVEKFEQSEKELGLRAESQSESALRAGRYQDACTIVANFEASQIFPRGIGINWSRYDATHDIEILNEIAAYSPPRHRGIAESTLANLRVSAGMMNLWGENSPLKWLIGPEREFACEARLTLWAAIEKVRLKEFRRAGIRQVKILNGGRDDACDICKEPDGKIYMIQSAPELPHGQCTCLYGCRCIFVAV